MKRYLHIVRKAEDSIRFITLKQDTSSSKFMQFNPITYEEETRQMFRQASDFELVEKVQRTLTPAFYRHQAYSQSQA